MVSSWFSMKFLFKKNTKTERPQNKPTEKEWQSWSTSAKMAK